MFDYDLFYKDITKVDLKKFSYLIRDSQIDFLSIDKLISSYVKSHFTPYWYDMTVDYSSKVYYLFQYYFDNFGFELLLARKFNTNLYRRTLRLKRRVDFMISNFDCLFLTFTFNDNVLNSTNCSTRRKYLTRALRTLNCYCVANIDFGNSNNYVDIYGFDRVGTSREHYHAIVSVGYLDNTNSCFWHYGGVNFEPIIVTKDVEKRTSKYIIKLTSHCVKSSTDLFNSSIIYIKPKKNKKSL